MSLREDLDAQERASRAGKWAEFMRGEYIPPRDPYPTDRSTRPGLSDQAWLRARGE